MNYSIEFYLLIFSLLFLFSLLLGKTGYKYGVPALLIFLFIGMLAGSDGLGLQFNALDTAKNVGTVALCVILFSGGMDTRMDEVRPVWRQGVALAIMGVLLTALITGGFIYWITNNIFKTVGFTLVESLLLASVMSSTDSASVFGILRSRNVSLKKNLRPILELESGSNDPMAYMMTIVFIQVALSPVIDGWEVVLTFIKQLSFGVLVGYAIGKFSPKLINRINLDNDALYPVLLITIMLFVFGISSFIGGNGYLAVYLCALLLGNQKFVHKRSTLKFFDGLTWLSQIILFLMLGLLVNPKELLHIAGLGLLIGLFMTFISRPIAVFTTLIPFKDMSLRGKTYLSWVGLRGAVPIIFAIYPLLAGVPHSRDMFNIVFFITIVSLVVQGTTVAKASGILKLNLLSSEKIRMKEFDVEFSDEIKTSMREIRIKEEYLSSGSRIMDLNLPNNALITMVKRNDKYLIPKGKTPLKKDDYLLVITDDQDSLNEIYPV
ncbi:MAG: potassium/proton antiporter [Parabacteroides sp.]